VKIREARTQIAACGRSSSAPASSLAILVLLGAVARADDPPPPGRESNASSRPDAAPPPAIAITEIHYRPPASREGTEFVEVTNVVRAAADISGWRFTRGIDFTFPPGTRLEPGASIVVARDVEAFRAAFGNEVRLAGAFRGKLDNGGELLRLSDASGASACDLRYLDVPPWPDGADGGGASLTRRRLERDSDDPGNWVAARPSPGLFTAAAESTAPPSLYGLRRSPGTPGPGEPVDVAASIHRGARGATVRLRYEVDGARKSVPMKEAPAAEGRDPVVSAAIPGQPRGTIVRYWIEAEADGGETVRLPHAEAPTPHLAYRAGGAGGVATKLPFYEIIIEPDLLRLLQANPYSNELQPAVFVAGGDVYDVGLRCRGAWARSWPKKCWKVVFRKDHPFEKQKRINLNSAWRDQAYIREPLAYEIFREAGSLSLRSRMVRLHVNGRFWGLFVEVEQPGKRLLGEWGIEGAILYKAASRSREGDERAFETPGEYAGHYTLETGKEQSHEELWRFCRGLEAAEDPARFLEERLDIDRYLDYACASVLTQNWDAYNKNHFLAFDAERSRKWSVIPWDLDRTLGDHWDWEFDVVSLPILSGTRAFPGTTGWNRLLDRFLEVPSFRKRFHDRLRRLLEETFTEEKLRPRIDALEEEIAAEADLDRRRWGGDPDWRSAVEQLERYVTGRREFILSQLPGGEPRVPVHVGPERGQAAGGRHVVLEVGPYGHDVAGIAHRATRWQVRAEGGSYAAPVVDETTAEHLTRYRIPEDRLRPRTAYRWRAAHIGSNGKSSELSAEAAFVTGDFPFRATRFDLSAHFNRDLVANPGDRSTDFLDDRGGWLIEDGFDGRLSGNPMAQGLPRDRRVGVHVLGDYGRPNALQIAQGEGPVRIAAPPGRYDVLKVLVAGGGGDSRMPVVLQYAGGEEAAGMIHCDDWYDDNPPEDPPGSLGPGVVAALNGMDRIRSGSFKDRNEPALFEVTIPADPRRVLEALVLDPGGAEFTKGDRTRFNLFAVTGVSLAAQ
jgi:spore coat protein H